MSTISKKLSGFIFNGPTLVLANAAFKSNLNIVYGFHPSGTGYVSYKPSSNFNSLTQLVQDGVYTVDAVTTGFDIPGATLTAAPVSINPLTVTNLKVGNLDSSYPNVVYAEFDIASSDANEVQGFLTAWQLSGADRSDPADTYAFSIPGHVTLPLASVNGYFPGGALLTITTCTGNVFSFLHTGAL